MREPRAVSIDDEALRTMQAAGLISPALADVALDRAAQMGATRKPPSPPRPISVRSRLSMPDATSTMSWRRW